MLSSIDSYRQMEYDYDYFHDDLTDLLDPNALDDYYPDYSLESVSFLEYTRACLQPTLYDVCTTYFPVLCICFLFHCFNKFVRRKFSWKHFFSGFIGIGILYSYVQNLIVHPIALASVSYVIILFTSRQKYTSFFFTISLLCYLTLCEFVCEGLSWARVRNVQMLIVMKLISLISNLHDKRIQLPSFTEFFGYLFCVGNCIFGPWIDFSSYMDLFRPTRKLNVTVAVRLVTSVLKSLFFFSLSMCYIEWIWPETNEKDPWLMYFKALEFRTSHYFIMFMCESFSVAIGHDRLDDSFNSKYMTKPSSIEFPRSLVEVVIFWNVPMHVWLKTYVFRPLSKYGRFVAVIGTFFISSLLHGLNYQLSGILLSLAIYTYVEYVFRSKLSRKFDACLLSKSCGMNCKTHRHTEKKIPVRLLNLGFSILALYHLSYLGFLIDLRNDQKLEFFESFKKWKDEAFSSHFVVLITYGLSLLLC
ncbi:hypothetical protein V9T40_005456 [Parthenolecanium corni]|uniref:Protein-serine O-palmitoleoyltransferase porcupine n=1 Tax=Parthenolecanium corni TaxID=536013 RepID=A0AAN9TT01_9HEMI